jgi:LPS export ABC transporter protein LptC
MKMALLALPGALFASLACRDQGRPTAFITPADSADQVMYGMQHYVTEDGVRRARVRADTAYFYSATQTADLHSVHITFYDAAGAETSTLTSRQGTYHWRTGDMEAHGNVVVVTTDGRTLHSDALHYSQAKSEVTSDGPFIFDGPNRHVEGEGFTSDPDFKNVVAKHPKGTGGKFTLPNQ